MVLKQGGHNKQNVDVGKGEVRDAILPYLFRAGSRVWRVIVFYLFLLVLSHIISWQYLSTAFREYLLYLKREVKMYNSSNLPEDKCMLLNSDCGFCYLAELSLWARHHLISARNWPCIFPNINFFLSITKLALLNFPATNRAPSSSSALVNTVIHYRSGAVNSLCL